MPDTRPLRVAVVDPALDPTLPMWGSCTGGWQPGGVAWLGLLLAAGVPVTAGDDGRGLLIAGDTNSPACAAAVDRALSVGRPVITAPPPDDPAEALALVRDALGALVRPDLRGVLVLRLDDPGASVRRHLRSWRHPDVTSRTWAALWDELSRSHGRVSVFCCPGWVTEKGEILSSRHVNGEEWAALDRGVSLGVADLECHGFTHLDPRLDEWVAAPDRFDAEDWYREFHPPRQPVEPSVAEQAAIIGRWQAECGPGTTLVAPGEAWGLNTIAAARRQGLRLFCSWEVCRLDVPGAPPAWTCGIGSPYLDEPDRAWFRAGLPTVGYWHDRDMAIHGPGWVTEQLASWRDSGARKVWAFADLARAYATPIDAALVDGEVVVRAAPKAVRLLVER